MLKYLKLDVVFQEIPDEMSLAIAISGCQVHCRGCNQRELWEDKGYPLDVHTIENMLYNHKGITCLLLLGGEHDIDSLIEIFQYAHRRIKTAWYCGLDMIPKDKRGILQYLDYVKVGRFDPELGPLNDPNTNQRLYILEHQGDGNYYETDITSRFWHNKKEENN